LSRSEYEPDWYTDYCAGVAYIITIDLIEKMYSLSKHVKFVWIDDFFMTGVLAAVAYAKFATMHKYCSIFEHPRAIIHDIKRLKQVKDAKMIFHQLNSNARNLIWFYLTEKCAEEYFQSTKIDLYTNLDDYYWTHYDYWDRVLNRRFLKYEDYETFENNSYFMNHISNDWKFR
jgi:hypothetical protein